MIETVVWRAAAPHLSFGGVEQIERWQQTPDSFLWLNIRDEDEAVERALLESFGCHPLAVRDALKGREPPKYRFYDKFVFILLRGLDADSVSLRFGTVQIAFFVGERCLLTRSSGPSPSLRKWWQDAELADYLARGPMAVCLRVASTAAQRYVDLLLNFEPRLGELEDGLMAAANDTILAELIQDRTNLRKLWRIFSYQERLFAALREHLPGRLPLAAEERQRLLDVHERFERLHSLGQLYYSVGGDLVEGYISLSSHELNRKIGVLTVLTAIFVPMTFIAGVYGMNFENMPELHWHWGYFSVMGVMVAMAASLVVLFRRKRWL
ncbi:MAG: magnesium transporter CorA family protein [Porticoccaceae bacterium]